jgi:hypothetical protein
MDKNCQPFFMVAPFGKIAVSRQLSAISQRKKLGLTEITRK